jgi:hypothetical protein
MAAAIVISGDKHDGMVLDLGGVSVMVLGEPPLATRYVQKTIVVLGVRNYRIWITEAEWAQVNRADGTHSAEEAEALEAEVLLRLIDTDCASRCRQPD